MNGPGTYQFARGDASQPRQPSLFRVDSTYTMERASAAMAQQGVTMAITAAIALGVLWYLGRQK